MSYISCSKDILSDTIDRLKRGGERGEERVVLWLSRPKNQNLANVDEVYEPLQTANVDYFRLPPESMRLLVGHLRSTRRKIVAQIHTHPGIAFHSEADADWSIIRHIGALSLVLPYFATRTTPTNFLEEVMTYEYSSYGDWVHRPNFGSDLRLVVRT